MSASAASLPPGLSPIELNSFLIFFPIFLKFFFLIGVNPRHRRFKPSFPRSGQAAKGGFRDHRTGQAAGRIVAILILDFIT
jgi:hypothetical protein